MHMQCCRFLRRYGYRRGILDDHLRTLGGPGRGGVSPGRYASFVAEKLQLFAATESQAEPQLTLAAVGGEVIVHMVEVGFGEQL